MVLACRFVLENWLLDRWVRNILTVYPVVIVALVGNIWRHHNPADPSTNAVFTGELLRLLLCLDFLEVSLVWGCSRPPLSVRIKAC